MKNQYFPREINLFFFIQLNKNIPLLADSSIYEGTSIVTYEQLLKDAGEEQEDTLNIKKYSNQLAIVLYTSGSTGVPKGNITFLLIIQYTL